MKKIFKILALTPLLVFANSCSTETPIDTLDEFTKYIIGLNNSSDSNLTYKLTVNYVNEGGGKVADSHVDVIKAGESFLVVPPEVSGLKPNMPYVEGYMNSNKTINVYYDTVSVWDGVSATAFSGNGTQASPYLIESAANLAYLANLESDRSSNTADPLADKYYRVTNHIDLGNHPWKPIGTNNAANYARPFQGHFDGKNHLITGLYINKPTGISYGLFGAINSTATISNLVVEGNVTGYSRTGLLLACINANTASVSNIKTFGSVTSTGDKSNSQYVGAIAGVNKGLISNCANYATVSSLLYGGTGGISGTTSYQIENSENYGIVTSGTSTGVNAYGGISGFLSADNAVIKGCSNYARLDFYCSKAGGIVGNLSKGKIESCNNYGAIYANNVEIGGIVGNTGSAGKIESSDNYGYLKSTSGSFAGISGLVNGGSLKLCNNYYRVEGPGKYTSGIGGNCYGTNMVIDSCNNYGNIVGENYVSGICGYVTQDIKNCTNYGNVTGVNYVTGVVSYLLYGRTSNCHNEGKITGESAVGGIVGYYNIKADVETYIEKCSNKGDITGETKVGGVCGHNQSGTIRECSNSGTISGTGSYVGGVCGHLTHTGVVYSSKNTGDVFGKNSVGGVIGYAGASTNQYDNETAGNINGVYSDTKVVGHQA